MSNSITKLKSKIKKSQSHFSIVHRREQSKKERKLQLLPNNFENNEKQIYSYASQSAKKQNHCKSNQKQWENQILADYGIKKKQKRRESKKIQHSLFYKSCEKMIGSKMSIRTNRIFYKYHTNQHNRGKEGSLQKKGSLQTMQSSFHTKPTSQSLYSLQNDASQLSDSRNYYKNLLQISYNKINHLEHQVETSKAAKQRLKQIYQEKLKHLKKIKNINTKKIGHLYRYSEHELFVDANQMIVEENMEDEYVLPDYITSLN